MAAGSTFDVIVVGGGIAGSTLGGVLARSGLGVLVIEREAQFRDRIRGECTWPWGVAEIRRLGLDDLLTQVGAVKASALRFYADRQPVATAWECAATGDIPGLGFSHPRFQEAAFAWAAAQGATTVRPAKAARFARARLPSVTVVQNGREVEHRARLVVAADGKLSAARRWTGGESRSDPEHHRIGGVLVAGAAIERTTVGAALQPGSAAAWFAAGPDLTRVYLAIDAPQSRSAGVDRSFTAFRAFVSARMPTYALMQAQQAGPLGFFPNSNTWATRIAGNGVALVGDAAGSADPTYGHGTSLLFRDVRILGELLCSTADWDAAVADFADRRRKAFDVIRASDRWAALCNEASEEAARRRDGNERALQQDPTLGGFALLHTAGPDGLLADETARRHYFGEDLS